MKSSFSNPQLYNKFEATYLSKKVTHRKRKRKYGDMRKRGPSPFSLSEPSAKKNSSVVKYICCDDYRQRQ